MNDFSVIVVIFVIVVIANIMKKAGGSLVGKVSDSIDQFQTQLNSWEPGTAGTQGLSRPAESYRKRHRVKKRKSAMKKHDDDSRNVQKLAREDNLYALYDGKLQRAERELLGRYPTEKQVRDLEQKLDWLMGRALSGSKEERYYKNLLTRVRGKMEKIEHHQQHHLQGLTFLNKPLDRKKLVEGIVMGEILKRKHFDVNN